MFNILCALFMIFAAIQVLCNEKIPPLIMIPAVINTLIAIANAGQKIGYCFWNNVNPSEKPIMLVSSILFLVAAFLHGSIVYKSIFKRREKSS